MLIYFRIIEHIPTALYNRSFKDMELDTHIFTTYLNNPLTAVIQYQEYI